MYPHNQELTPKLDTLASKAEHFKTAKDQLEEARKAVEEAYTAVSNKQKELAKLADERAGFRQDIKVSVSALGRERGERGEKR